MCNILWLKAGQMPLKEEFWNMCYNNWHSYGLITKVDGQLDIKKVVPTSGEVDPQEVWDLILKDRQYERFLHVRHNTAGTTSEENCHPFSVLFQERKGKTPLNLQFMHNGTLYDFKSKKMSSTGTMIDDDSGPSDTQNFVNQVLVPYLSSLDTGNGKGNLEDPLIKGLIRKFWPLTGNRGIVISGDQAPLLLGDWKKMKAADGSDIVSSNDDYFSKVSRGPEFDRREAAEKERQAKNRALASSTMIAGASSFRTTAAGTHVQTGDVVPFTRFDFCFKDRTPTMYDLKTSFAHILNDWNVWDRDVAVSLGAATADELKELVDKNPKDAVILMDWIFADYAKVYEELCEVEEKHRKATDRIATVTGELNELRKWCSDNGLFDKNKKVS